MIAAPASAQSVALDVVVARSAGSLEESAVRRVVEAARAELATCASPGVQAYAYELSLRPNGTVREASYDRRAAADARGARCMRHALLELQFPAHDLAGTFTLTLTTGGAAAPPPVATAPVATAPVTAPVPTAPVTAPPVTAPPVTAPPVATAPVAGADVRIGPLAATAGRSADLLRSVVAAQLTGLASCFATARATDAALAGDATLHLGIAPDGRVTSALFQAPEALASALTACIAQLARTWVFSSTSADERASIPLSFGPPRPARH